MDWSGLEKTEKREVGEKRKKAREGKKRRFIFSLPPSPSPSLGLGYPSASATHLLIHQVQRFAWRLGRIFFFCFAFRLVEPCWAVGVHRWA